MNAMNPIRPDRDGHQPEERAERQMDMLRELAELSMALARAAARKALRQTEGEAADGPDPATMFAKLSREIRETIKLEAAIAAGAPPARQKAYVGRPQAPPEDASGGEGRRAALLRLLTEAIEADHRIDDPRSIVPDIEEVLDEPQVAAAIRGGAPLRGIIEQVCDELGITFDYAVLPEEQTPPVPN